MIEYKNHEIHFKRLPLWKGIQDKPFQYEFAPFSLGLHHNGYIFQSTADEVLSKVIASYAAENYQHDTPPPGTSAWGNVFGEKAMRFILDEYESLSGLCVIDIGAGSTSLAEKMISYDVAGYTIVDPSIRAQTGIPNLHIMREYFSSETCKGKKYDLVISMNCLEHVQDPLAFLCNIYSVLDKERGKVILIFPDVENQFIKGDFNVIAHEHIGYFTKGSFEKIVARSGLFIKKSMQLEDTLYCTLEINEAKKPILSVNHFSNEPLMHIAEMFKGSLDYFKRMLVPFIENKQRIAFHGACAGLNNLLALSGFHEYSPGTFSIFDSDEAKEGKYLPMCPTPILHSKCDEYRKIDRVVIAAMTFYDEIKEYLVSYHTIPDKHIYSIYPTTDE
jgi:2-polyprenyl-3-methyl-5-hydroxy-6-metoxy-1,4-benzoquinol methylase